MSTMTTEFVAVDKNFKTTVEGMINKKDQLIQKMRQELREAGRTGAAHQKHGKQGAANYRQMGGILRRGIIGPLTALAAPAGALAAINSLYASWLQYTREIGRETRKMTGEVMAFLALQEAGERAPRLSRALSTAALHGVERGPAINTIQSLQSVYGSFEGGIASARMVFLASRLGIPIESGRALEAKAQSVGLGPGVALAMAQRAGELSGEDPATIAKATPALVRYDDPRFAFSVATGLTASPITKERLETYTRQTGAALSSISGAKDWYQKMGLAKATQFERLQALAAAGIDTDVELAGIGITQERQVGGLVAAISTLEKVKETFKGLQTLDPDVFRRKLMEIESEVPFTRYARETEQLGVMAENAMVTGPGALAAMKADKASRLRALAIRESGLEFTPFGRTISGEGADIYQTLGDKLQLLLHSFFGLEPLSQNLKGTPSQRVKAKEEEILSRLDGIYETNRQAAEALKNIAGETSRGPLSSPTSDR